MLVQSRCQAPRSTTLQYFRVSALQPRLGKITRSTSAQAFHIDRAKHLEYAWKRQEEREQLQAAEQAGNPVGSVIDIRDLLQLEQLFSRAGNNLVVVFFYSKSCGVCKETAQRYELVRRETQSQRARVVFAKHNVINEFDEASDVARYYKVKAVPCFLFYDDGALVKRLSLRDIRSLAGPPVKIQQALAEDMRKIKQTLFEVLFERAPSARN